MLDTSTQVSAIHHGVVGNELAGSHSRNVGWRAGEVRNSYGPIRHLCGGNRPDGRCPRSRVAHDNIAGRLFHDHRAAITHVSAVEWAISAFPICWRSHYDMNSASRSPSSPVVGESGCDRSTYPDS